LGGGGLATSKFWLRNGEKRKGPDLLTDPGLIPKELDNSSTYLVVSIPLGNKVCEGPTIDRGISMVDRGIVILDLPYVPM
jgi:hypothetical protein